MAIAKAASDKKALDITTLDMRKIPSVSDYFVLASGTSTTQVRAISDNIVEKLREKGERVWHIEGEREALWVLLDFGDVVAHIFFQDMRKFYELEKLWSGCPQHKFREEKPRRKTTRKKKIRSKVIKKRIIRKRKKLRRG